MHTRSLSGLLALFLTLWVFAGAHAQTPPGGAPKTIAPLTEAERAMLWGTPEDREPSLLNATSKKLEGRHYLTGDERHLDLFYPTVKDLGGGYMGVGTDQAYLFIGWMKADYGWLTDYDPWVKNLHLAYTVFFTRAETIDDFLSYWKPKNANQTKKLLFEVYGKGSQGKAIVKVYGQTYYRAYRRFMRLKTTMKAAKVPSFVTDPEMYAYVRNMVVSGRVRPMVGNLLGDKGIKGLAEVAKSLKVPIRVLYPSNAEQYWRYSKAFRENMKALPIDERSVVVRTFGTMPWNGDYHYNVQTFSSFVQWLDAASTKSVRNILPLHKQRPRTTIILTLVNEPPKAPKQRRHR